MANFTLLCNELRQAHASFGAWPTARNLLLRVVNRILPCRLLEVMVLEQLTPDAQTKTAAHLVAGRLDPSQTITWQNSPEYVWPDQGLERTIRNGDRCYGVFDRQTNRPAATGWYAPHSTVNDGCPVRVDAQYVYMHCGFTHADYRGLRLHAVGMATALAAFRSEGFRGIICEVDSRNLASLKSCYRMGWRRVGYMLALWPNDPSRRVNLHSAGCRRAGLHMDRPRSGKPVKPALAL